MISIASHSPALLVTGASLLMSLLLLGLWRVSSQPRERFLLLASIAQFIFTLNQIPLFFDSGVFFSRHVFVKAKPGAMTVSSGTVTSATNWAASQNAV